MESAARQVRRLAALVPLLLIGTAHAQGLGPPDLGVISYLNDSTGTAATFVSPQNPLPVTGGGGGGTVTVGATAASTLPTLGPGMESLYENLSGGLYIQPIFGNTIVGPTNGLPVSIVSGGGGGDVSSAFGSAFPPAGEASGFRDPNGNMHYGSVDLGGLFQVGNPVWTVVGPGTGTNAQRIAISSDPADNTVTIAQNPLTVIGTVNQGAPAVPTDQWPVTLYTGINQLAINGSGEISCANCGGSSSGPPMDMVIGPTVLTSAGTATLAVGTQGSGATTIVLTASSGLTATFQGLTPAGWSAVAMDNTATGQTVSSASADGIFQTNSAGYSQIRVNVQAGTTTASLESSAGSIPTGVDSAIYMATPPSLSDGTPAGMTMTSDARLRVSLDTAAPTDRSGSIAAGGASQTLAASNANRRRIKVQNPCSATSQGIGASENLFIRFNGAASTSAGNSVELLPCGSFDSGGGPTEATAVTVIAATTGHQYFAVEQ